MDCVQQVIGSAIVDFCARTASLVVEVDGDEYHRQRRSADEARDRKLVRAGYTVVRLPASLIERDLSAAVAHVVSKL